MSGQFTVWANFYTEGWSPSDPFETLDECLGYITGTLGTSPYRITRDVHVELREKTA